MNHTPTLFAKTRSLELRIDELLDKVAEGGILFERGMTLMLERGLSLETEEKLQQLIALKERCNQLRRAVVNTLYSEMLIPEFRGDVLRLLSHLYGLLDSLKNAFQEFLIAYADVLSRNEAIADVKQLVAVVVESVQAAVLGARAFFRNPEAVRDHINRIRVFESEADGITVRLKTALFASDRPLEQKLLGRDALALIDGLADLAEEISDELSILAIKRAL
jgi:predicted phosphate transport protein (TIGR00153 family)